MSQDQLPPEGDNEFSDDSFAATPNNDFGAPEQPTQLGQAAPAVAAPQSRMVVLIFVLVAIGGAVLYMLMHDDSAAPSAESAQQETAAPIAAEIEPPAPLPTPTPPEPEEEQNNSAPLPPPPLPPEEIVEDEITPMVDPAEEARKKQEAEELRIKRLRSGMLISNKDSLVSSAMGGGENTRNTSDRNSQFGDSAAQDEVDVVVAERMKNTSALIAQGKVIDVVLESAINTDLPAPIRAIVSRDIYAESGRTALIPKGSRVIGRYNTDILGTQKRVYIIWNRIIRPDGISILINSPGVDQIGRGGVEGLVDKKYLEIYSLAFLSSLVTIGTAIGADQLTDGQVTTTASPLGGTQNTGSAGAMAVQQAVTDFGATSTRVVQGSIDTRPTIMIDQGTRMNIFVNHDLSFPQDVLSGPVVVN